MGVGEEGGWRTPHPRALWYRETWGARPAAQSAVGGESSLVRGSLQVQAEDEGIIQTWEDSRNFADHGP